VNIQGLSLRALQVALAIEVIWTGFLIYEYHYQRSTAGAPWDLQVQFFAQAWAAPAIAIVVIVWLIEAVIREARR
jgi:hypothetical protein